MSSRASVDAWRDRGRLVEVGGDPVFVLDEAGDPQPGIPPLLVLHGFPTCSFDYAGVLPALSASRRVVLPDHLGHGLSAKPDRRYGIRMMADAVSGAVEALGIDEVDLLTHDVGDSVGGELLARDLDGELPFAVRRRVVTNGSIYMDLVQLTDGQQLLLSLPDEATDLITEDTWKAALRRTFAPSSPVPDEELDAQWQLTAIDDGHRLLPRTIRYIEDRRAEERRYTGPIETHPAPLAVVWGALDPIAVLPMAERLAARRAEIEGEQTSLTVLDDVGHYPMLEAPDRFAAAVLAHLDA